MNFNQVLEVWGYSLKTAWNVVFTKILLFLPNLIAGLLLFWLGVILANWLYRLTKTTLNLVKLDKLVHSAGLNQFLKRAEISTKVEEVVAVIVKWLVLVIVLISVLNIVGLTGVSDLLGRILAFLPQVISAVVVLAIGLALAGLVESLLKGAIIPFDLKLGRLTGKIGSYMVAILAVMAAFQELGIAQDLIRTIYIGFVLSISLAIGLSFGLGSKKIVEEIMLKWYKELNKKAKKQVR